MAGKAMDIIGRRFGSLVVKDRADPKDITDNHSYWLCSCDCGYETVVRGTRLTSGRQVSCGCWRANPAVRQAARLTIPPEERTRLAKIRK